MASRVDIELVLVSAAPYLLKGIGCNPSGNSALLFRNLASHFFCCATATHCAPLRMDLLGFTKKRQNYDMALSKPCG